PTENYRAGHPIPGLYSKTSACYRVYSACDDREILAQDDRRNRLTSRLSSADSSPQLPFPPMIKPFGKTPGGAEARLFPLENASGLRAEVSDYGGTVVRLFAPN